SILFLVVLVILIEDIVIRLFREVHRLIVERDEIRGFELVYLLHLDLVFLNCDFEETNVLKLICRKVGIICNRPFEGTVVFAFQEYQIG
ncbi:hypothetical protein PMAYCL1PPCAC_08850, partial [Pristionchus mayeri]